MADRTSNGQSAPDLGTVATVIGVAISLAAAWLYVAGWTYAYWYFDNYQLGLLTLDIPRDSFLVYGFWVLIDRWPWVVAILVVAFVSSFLAWRYAISPRWPLLSWVAVLLIPTAFLLGYGGAKGSAADHFRSDQASEFQAARRVEVLVKPTWQAAQSTKDLATALASGCFRLLLKNEDSVFLLRPVRDLATADQPLLALPWSEIHALRILTDSDSCP